MSETNHQLRTGVCHHCSPREMLETTPDTRTHEQNRFIGFVQEYTQGANVHLEYAWDVRPLDQETWARDLEYWDCLVTLLDLREARVGEWVRDEHLGYREPRPPGSTYRDPEPGERIFTGRHLWFNGNRLKIWERTQ